MLLQPDDGGSQLHDVHGLDRRCAGRDRRIRVDGCGEAGDVAKLLDFDFFNETPAFFTCMVSGVSSAPGSSRIGLYSVNKITGLVWDTGPDCRRISSRSVARVQKTIQHVSDVPAADWRRLQRLKPSCLLN